MIRHPMKTLAPFRQLYLKLEAEVIPAPSLDLSIRTIGAQSAIVGVGRPVSSIKRPGPIDSADRDYLSEVQQSWKVERARSGFYVKTEARINFVCVIRV